MMPAGESLLSCVFLCAEWQHPYVNVFKHVGLDKWTDVNKQGDVVPIIVRCTS